MPLSPIAPDYASQLTGLLQSAPNYVAPDFSQITNPRQQLENAGMVQQQQDNFENQGLRERAFQMQQQQEQQQYDFNQMMNPLRLAGANAQNTLMQQQVDRSTDAFTRLPDLTQEINDLDPSDEMAASKMASIMAGASDNPALFQSLQSAAQGFQMKRQAYLGSAAGAAVSSLQGDVVAGTVPVDTYAKVKAMYQQAASSPTPDFTGVFSAVRDVNTQKAAAARDQLQQVNSQLGAYAVPIPPRLSAGIYDPAELQEWNKDYQEALKQKAEDARQSNIAGLKNAGQLDLQDARNQGRMDVTIQRYGASPGGQTQQGKQMVMTANALAGQLKNPNLAPADRARLQGQLDGLNDAMTQQLGLPTSPASTTSDLAPADAAAANTLDTAINTVQKQVDLGNDDLPKGVSLPTGVSDPYSGGILGTGFGGTNTGGLSPNQFRLQHFRNQRAALQPQAAVPAATFAAPAASAQAAAPGSAPTFSDANDPNASPFASILNSGNAAPVQSLTPMTDQVEDTTAPAAPAPKPVAPVRRAPPPQAVTHLQQHPELAAQFDAWYGPGSAAQYLKR